MNKRSMRILGFYQVQNLLVRLAPSRLSKEIARRLRPVNDGDVIEKNLIDTEEAVRCMQTETSTPFGGIVDIRPSLEKAKREVTLDSHECIDIWNNLQHYGEIRSFFAERGAEYPQLAEQAEVIGDFSQLSHSFATVFDNNRQIRDNASPELMRLRSRIVELERQTKRYVNNVLQNKEYQKYFQDALVTVRNNRYVIPIKQEYRHAFPGIVHDTSASGSTLYVEPLAIVNANNDLQAARIGETKEIERIFRRLTAKVQQQYNDLYDSTKCVGQLEFAFAKAQLALKMKACRPAISKTREIRLIQARHPLIDAKHVVPNTIVIGGDYRILLITGSNAGGKTVCLKTLGLLAIMTLAGLPVPAAKGSVIPWWTSIHAFIGDEQSLDDHLSTFTAQIRHLGNAWEATDRRTLILLDEFGAGTDPAQGAALAQAVLDGLLERGAHVVAATHFPALKTYALTREGVRAASVLFDPGTKKPLFRLAYDQVGASQALDVAREHGLPESVLRRAEQYLLLDGQDMTAVMDRLNALAAKREGELDALKAEQQRTREKRKAVQERFERERERLIKDVRELSAKVMKDWQEGKAGHKQALKELAKVRAELHVSAEQEEAAAPAFDIAELKPGQHVMHRPWNKKAVVREVDARQNRVKLDMNGVTLWADAALLGPADAPQQQAKPKSGVLVRTTAGSDPEMSLLRLDLRGKRADQALGELSQYLDRALLSGREGVEIVHGRGTGALRKEVHAFLKTFPGIASFALAPEDQGGDGVTIVTFK